MDEIHAIVNRMEPEQAMAAMAKALKSIFPVLSEEARGRFLMELLVNPMKTMCRALSTSDWPSAWLWACPKRRPGKKVFGVSYSAAEIKFLKKLRSSMGAQ